MTESDDYYTGPSKFSPIPLTVSSPSIKPEDRNMIVANAVESMHAQAEQQLAMLRRQAEVILSQVKDLEERIQVSKQIYEAQLRFSPSIGKIYHLYEKEEKGEAIMLLSLVGPEEWGRKFPYKSHKATVKLLPDHTWEVMNITR